MLLFKLLLLTIFWWCCWFAESPPPPWKNISLFSNLKHYLLCTKFWNFLSKIIFAVAVVSHKILTILHKFFLPLLCVITDSTSTWNYMITLIFWKNSEGREKYSFTFVSLVNDFIFSFTLLFAHQTFFSGLFSVKMEASNNVVNPIR